jgi:hypothetical protein
MGESRSAFVRAAILASRLWKTVSVNIAFPAVHVGWRF